jgi:hypothetical protein
VTYTFVELASLVRKGNIKKIVVLCLGLSVVASVLARADSASERYQRYREIATEPSYALKKVKAMIHKLKPDHEDAKALSNGAFAGLSLEEKFTYTMLHGENFTQNCNAVELAKDEDKRICAYPASPFNEEEIWSDRQRGFLKANRPRVIELLRSTITSHRRVGVNLKAAIIEIRGRELIPDLVAAYKRDGKDQDILTVLLLLMRDGKFKPFVASSSYQKLYGDRSNYEAYLVANEANKKLVIDRALAYFRARAT